MTTLEKQIIQLITQNAHFSEELKKRYILAMFLMESDKQQEYKELLEKFTKRCEEMNRGIFVIKPSDLAKTMRTYEEVKKDLLLKLNTDRL
ncbi:hypothetical protein IPJ72_01470 [Candidatus Peregrinibacteria bacterium]|nr:MAG: hypothetical protein IPJ72_01470 [Candidatus Peregrinibacteria bacterium]